MKYEVTIGNQQNNEFEASISKAFAALQNDDFLGNVVVVSFRSALT